ncbi:MAG TPA: FtsX-like permease family protein [Steroidobacteraceae bacterium]|nr:FtsX-like permease family protein [Steroidobacteraceae bacterium]
MSIPMRPILSALLRNRTGALLVALQISIALAVLVNAVYIVKQRIDLIGRPTGIDVANIFVVASTGFARGFNYEGALRDDLAYFRSVPGVIAATPINSLPLSGGGSATMLAIIPGDTVHWLRGNYFEVNEQGLQTLGLHLIAGRNFRPDEVLPPPESSQANVTSQIIVTKAYAQRLFPNGSALGKTVYDAVKDPVTIIGIVDNMMGSWVDDEHPEEVFMMPRAPTGPTVRYLVRTEPGSRDAIMRTVEGHISSSNPNRSINWVRTLERYKDRSYLKDRNMGIFLATVTSLLLAITTLGIFGLATFNVSTRTKQIGTRRAVGARQRDIVRYFLTENWFITTAGVILGCAMALGVGYWLSHEYHLPRVDLYYLVAGVLVLWAIGLLASWQPARRAAKISPAVAARTV